MQCSKCKSTNYELVINDKGKIARCVDCEHTKIISPGVYESSFKNTSIFYTKYEQYQEEEF